MTVVMFLLILAIVVRITRLLVDDTITKPIRDFLLVRTEPQGKFELVTDDRTMFGARHTVSNEVYVPGKRLARHHASRFLSEMLDCPWCTSVWVGGITLTVAAATHQISVNWFEFCGYWAAVAWLTGLASGLIGIIHGLERVEAAAVDEN